MPHIKHNVFTKYWKALLLLSILLIIWFLFLLPTKATSNGINHEILAQDLALIPDKLVDFKEQVEPILQRRCVVCHGCYDAPCQLKLSSIEGLQRGANEERIYEPKRIGTMEPTRLFIDAKNTAEWRLRNFFSVLNEGEQTPKNNLKNSVLYRLLNLKKQYPQAKKGMLSSHFTLELDREQSCPTLDTFDRYAQENPQWGMPYAMPNLSNLEHQTLVSWLAQGANAPPSSPPSTSVLPQIKQWEIFFNQPNNKQQLVSRYLYEHLFHAHIHFKNSPEREFYRLIRSTTPLDEKANEIATVRPYDSPGESPFYYRLIRYHPTIVVKSHIVYEFSPQKMQRYRELFIKPDYPVSELPNYHTKTSSNPFKVFSALPENARYRFLLDDAHFFIEGFIKGPVCRGQVALDVIEDQFWIVFFDPDQPLITNNDQFINRMSDELQVPADGGSSLELLRIWTSYWKQQRRYLEHKQAWFKTVGKHNLNHAIKTIWDGDGHNPNAALTVFRHFDSGSVAYGLVGNYPESAWVIDYPLFERIHYLLVAGFDVYGNIGHRLSTRIYMDFLRMEGEDSFLAFIPPSARKQIRDNWYQGQRSTVNELFSAPKEWLNTEVVSGFQTDDPQRELYQAIQKKIAPIALHATAMNTCGNTKCSELLSDSISSKVTQAMNVIAQLQGKNLHAFPDVAFVRIQMEDAKEDFAYTLIRNKAYKNVTSVLADEKKRNRADIDKDTMTVVNWLEGSYPNFFFSVKQSEIEAFTAQCANIHSKKDYEKFVDQYGVRRTHPEFWHLADWFVEEHARNKPVLSGLFDLNRYQNR
jgi:hypothetical protein